MMTDERARSLTPFSDSPQQQVDVSARGIKAQIQKLVADEDSKHPLTDQAIVNILKESGVQIARRTVAKYRDQLGVLSARMRKRV